MVENLNCQFEPTIQAYSEKSIKGCFHHVDDAAKKKYFEMVEIKTPEEFSQFWTCQSDAFCGEPHISKELINLVEKSCEEHFYDNDEAVYVGIKALAPSGKLEVVACGQLVIGKKYCSINHMATREGFRNRGFATFIMVALIDIAINRRKFNRVVLEATSMGCSIYEKFGFLPLFDYNVFEIDNHC